MTVDEFFQNGFEIPERTKAKRKRTTPGADRATKKRKQENTEDLEDEEEEDEEGSASEDNAAPDPAELSDDGSSDSDQDEETHKQQLEALAQKDPEFYKHLKEVEPELLDFEEGDFPELDQLSEDEKPSKKKRKAGKKAVEEESDDGSTGNVTMAMVNKWEIAMVEQKSLRSTREVVLAFRAAAHLNEEEGKAYKFTITDSDGMIYLPPVEVILT
jgi:nucleolar complex protein 2